MYGKMVKNAYEEILGFDKMAGIETMNIEKLDKKIGNTQRKVDSTSTGKLMSGGVGGMIQHQKRKGDLARMKLERQRREGTYGYAPSNLSKAAMAYYDEAQYVKEAAEADYAEACAYEDAAIQILDELGYLD